MSWTDVYYTPEKFGLEIVGDVDYSSGAYEFALLVVWKDESGQLYYAEDSGCSCPSPFEGVGLRDLTKATKFEIVARVQERLAEEERYGASWGGTPYEHTKTSAASLIEKLMAA